MPDDSCARHLLPNRDPATRQRRRPRTQSRRGLGGVPQIAPDRRPTAQSVASRHARWLAITARHCERQRGAPHRPEVSRFECVIHGAARRGREGAPQTPRSSAYLTMVWMHLWVHSHSHFLRGIATWRATAWTRPPPLWYNKLPKAFAHTRSARSSPRALAEFNLRPVLQKISTLHTLSPACCARRKICLPAPRRPFSTFPAYLGGALLH